MDLERRFKAGRDGRWSKWWAEARSLSNSHASASPTSGDRVVIGLSNEVRPSHAEVLDGGPDSDLLQTLLNRSSAFILVLDSSYRILSASRSFQNSVTNCCDPTGRNFIELLDARSQEKARLFLNNLGNRPGQIELACPAFPDSTRRIDYGFCRATSSSGSPIVAVGRDREDTVKLVEDIARHLDEQHEPPRVDPAADVKTDSLTGLGNRRWLFEKLDALWHESAEQGALVWVMIADLDRFKRVNESCGRDAGDELLTAIAQVLRSSIRGGDWVCRYGGDEFLLAGICHSELEMPGLAGRILSAIRSVPFEEGGKISRITVSLGAAVADPGEAGQPWLVLQAADRAIRRAKDGGRDRYDVEPGILGRPQCLNDDAIQQTG